MISMELGYGSLFLIKNPPPQRNANVIHSCKAMLLQKFISAELYTSIEKATHSSISTNTMRTT